MKGVCAGMVSFPYRAKKNFDECDSSASENESQLAGSRAQIG